MSFIDTLQHERALAIVAGLFGAAAMAATDWRSPVRLLQHIFVGTTASVFATPVFAPAISKVLSVIAVDPEAHGYAAAFITGAFAIYFLEFALAFWRMRTRNLNRGKDD